MGIFDNLAAPINQASLPPQFGGSTQAMDAGKLNYMAMLQPFLNAIQGGGGSSAPLVAAPAPAVPGATLPAPGLPQAGIASNPGLATAGGQFGDATRPTIGSGTSALAPSAGYVDRMKPLLTEAPQGAGGFGANAPFLADSVFRR